MFSSNQIGFGDKNHANHKKKTQKKKNKIKDFLNKTKKFRYPKMKFKKIVKKKLSAKTQKI